MSGCDNLATKADIDRIENKINAIQSDNQAILAAISGLGTQLDGFDNKLRNLQSDVTAIFDAIAGIGRQLDGFSSDLNAVLSAISGLGLQLDGFDSRLRQCCQDINSFGNMVSSQLSSIISSISALQNCCNRLENNQNLLTLENLIRNIYFEVFGLAGQLSNLERCFCASEINGLRNLIISECGNNNNNQNLETIESLIRNVYFEVFGLGGRLNDLRQCFCDFPNPPNYSSEFNSLRNLILQQCGNNNNCEPYDDSELKNLINRVIDDIRFTRNQIGSLYQLMLSCCNKIDENGNLAETIINALRTIITNAISAQTTIITTAINGLIELIRSLFGNNADCDICGLLALVRDDTRVIMSLILECCNRPGFDDTRIINRINSLEITISNKVEIETNSIEIAIRALEFRINNNLNALIGLVNNLDIDINNQLSSEFNSLRSIIQTSETNIINSIVTSRIAIISQTNAIIAVLNNLNVLMQQCCDGNVDLTPLQQCCNELKNLINNIQNEVNNISTNITNINNIQNEINNISTNITNINNEIKGDGGAGVILEELENLKDLLKLDNIQWKYGLCKEPDLEGDWYKYETQNDVFYVANNLGEALMLIQKHLEYLHEDICKGVNLKVDLNQTIPAPYECVINEETKKPEVVHSTVEGIEADDNGRIPIKEAVLAPVSAPLWVRIVQFVAPALKEWVKQEAPKVVASWLLNQLLNTLWETVFENQKKQLEEICELDNSCSILLPDPDAVLDAGKFLMFSWVLASNPKHKVYQAHTQIRNPIPQLQATPDETTDYWGIYFEPIYRIIGTQWASYWSEDSKRSPLAQGWFLDQAEAIRFFGQLNSLTTSVARPNNNPKFSVINNSTVNITHTGEKLILKRVCYAEKDANTDKLKKLHGWSNPNL